MNRYSTCIDEFTRHHADLHHSAKGGVMSSYDHLTDEAALRAMEEDIAAIAAKLDALHEALDECEDYFDQRADADMPQDGTGRYVPNEEMRLLVMIRRARGTHD